MRLTLFRTEHLADGIFGELTDDSGSFHCVTLEHSYPDGEGFSSKIPDGVYTCVRGEHVLHSSPHPFTTFEITGIMGHSGILFHTGNYNEESHGCVLLGRQIGHKTNGGRMIMNSKAAFAEFMLVVGDCEAFELKVESRKG